VAREAKGERARGDSRVRLDREVFPEQQEHQGPMEKMVLQARQDAIARRDRRASPVPRGKRAIRARTACLGQMGLPGLRGRQARQAFSVDRVPRAGGELMASVLPSPSL
jgi:hypothetical protein